MHVNLKNIIDYTAYEKEIIARYVCYHVGRNKFLMSSHITSLLIPFFFLMREQCKITCGRNVTVVFVRVI